MTCTHTGCYSLSNHVRTKTDEQIQALAEKGGVIGIGKFAPLLNVERVPTLDDFLNHIEHVIELVGIDHVGIGLDHTEKIELQNAQFIIGRTPELDALNWPELHADLTLLQESPPGGVNIKELDDPNQ